MSYNIKKWLNAIRYYFLYKQVLIEYGLFDTEYYTKQYASNHTFTFNPLFDYLISGVDKHRNPNPFFHTTYYISYYPDVLASGIHPLIHYLKFGLREYRKTAEHFPKGNLPTYLQENQQNELMQQYQFIKNSGLFDEQFYERMYADIAASNSDPCMHYLLHGWKEGRNPGPGFTTNYYIEKNRDVDFDEIHPLIHFIRFGRDGGRLGKPFFFNESDCLTKADICSITDIRSKSSDRKIAVVAHIYYPELAEEILSYVHNIPTSPDVFISTVQEHLEVISALCRQKIGHLTYSILPFNAGGRDILPFVYFLQHQLSDYDLVCKIHTKKSTHNDYLKDWRPYLLQNLLGSEAIVNQIIAEFASDEQLGLVWPVVYPYLSAIGLGDTWGNKQTADINKNLALRHFPSLEKYKDLERIDFPAGSMFWFRPKALSALAAWQVNFEELEQSNSETDGTLLHSIERSIGLLAKLQCFHHKTVYFPDKIRKSGIEKPEILQNKSLSVLFIAHDLCLAGAQMMLLHLIRWLDSHTYCRFHILAMQPGHDGGKLYQAYSEQSTLMIWQQLLETRSEEDAVSYVIEQTGPVDVIYGNTIMTAKLYPLLSKYNAPIITHIHELEKTIQQYTNEKLRDNLFRFTTHYIACANAVRENLVQNHLVPEEKISVIHEFIEADISNISIKEQSRKSSVMPVKKPVIWGCGTIYWRKGTDWFIQTAKALRDMGYSNFEFRWIGANYWHYESSSWGEWAVWETFICDNQLDDYITLFGELARPKDYYRAGDLYFLSSREDPFPLSCLEAAECGLPVICFENAGGMPEFVEEDAGTIIPYGDIQLAAAAIANYLQNPELISIHGGVARKKVLDRYEVNKTAPTFLTLFQTLSGKAPLVSVVVPVYNHGPYLQKRLDSIYNQTFRDFEVIILDDCSSDDSYQVARQYTSLPGTTLIKNDTNSGQPFSQWQKGIQMAKGTFIWIAEGDDMADVTFLEKMLPLFQDEKVGLAFGASHTIDHNDAVQTETYLYNGCYDGLLYEKSMWTENYIHEGEEEITNALAIRNTIPNASAVLFKRMALDDVDFLPAMTMKTVGDWYVYFSILSNHWRIAYNSLHLNYHRKHAGSVVANQAVSAKSTLTDYFTIHFLIIEKMRLPKSTLERMIGNIENGLWGLWPEVGDKEKCEYYNKEAILHKFNGKPTSNQQ